MGAAFSQNNNNNYALEIVKSIKSNTIKNADEIMNAIKEYRIEIAEQIEDLESVTPFTDEVERQIAILIRQDQYLQVLESKQKSDLSKMFFPDNDNCIVPEVFQWYQPPQE